MNFCQNIQSAFCIFAKFKTLSNDKYEKHSLQNLIYYINYALLEYNHIIKKGLGLTFISLIYYFHFSL